MRIVAGSASKALAEKLSALLDAPLAPVEVKQFPDEEVYVRVDEDVRGEHVVVVQSTVPNAKLVELLLLLDACHARGADTVTAVVPYYAYSRQDRAFREGECVSAQALAELIEVKADRFVTVDPHKEHILGFFGVEAHAGTAVPELASRLKAEGVDLVLAPDKGALDRAEGAAKQLGVNFDHLEKTRVSGTEVRMEPKNLDVAGQTVAIIDDIISTGGTIATAAGELKKQGAARVVAACTHGLFLNNALERLTNAGCDAVLATDTIEGPASLVSAADAVARVLKDVGVVGQSPATPRA
jgi:ribose-phosphate pyrophosphokinase